MLHLVEPAWAPVEMGQAVVEQYAVATETADANQAVVAQFAPGHFRAFGQGMIAPAGEHEGLVDQRRELRMDLSRAPDGAIEICQIGAQITEIQALVDAAQEVLGRDVIFQIERVEQALLSSR